METAFYLTVGQLRMGGTDWISPWPHFSSTLASQAIEYLLLQERVSCRLLPSGAFNEAEDQKVMKISAEAAIVWTSNRLFPDVDPLLV